MVVSRWHAHQRRGLVWKRKYETDSLSEMTMNWTEFEQCSRR